MPVRAKDNFHFRATTWNEKKKTTTTMKEQKEKKMGEKEREANGTF